MRRLLLNRLLAVSIAASYSLFIINLAAAAELPKKGDLNLELESANKLLSEKKYQLAYKDFLNYSDNNQLAQFSLGLFELYGWGRKENHKKACLWFEKAAVEDIPMAQELLGDCYRLGIHSAIDFKLAKKWYLLAIKNGLPQANCKLGKIYLKGKLVKKNTRKGIRLCEDAGNNGSLEAQLFLAQSFHEGSELIGKNLGRALFWYQSAAMANNSIAQYHYAELLYNGEAGVRDFAEALKSAESAATKGYGPAYFLTAKLYMSSPLEPGTQRPTAKNLAKSYMWVQAVLHYDGGGDGGKEKTAAKSMLEKIRTIMPKNWEEDLNGEVDDHFERLASTES